MCSCNKIYIVALFLVCLFCNTNSLCAKLPSGNISEKKQNTKVAKMLTTARKYVSKGKNQEAINTYWKILEINAHEPYAYLELGEIYKKLKIYDRSIEMLNSGLELGKDEIDSDTLCNYYCLLTEAYVITNQQGLANKSLIKAAEVSPRNPLPRKILGDIYLKNNRIANAAKAYKKALELDSYYEPAKEALENLKLEYGDKLPKADKDKDYIKRVAVKLKNQKQKDELVTDNNNSTKNKQISDVKDDNVESTKIEDSTELETNTNIQTNEVENNLSVKEEVLDNSKDLITEDNNTNTGINRPLPLEANELAKINNQRKKNKKQQNKKPKTAEEIEKAMQESETTLDKNDNSEISNKNQQYVDLFLAGNPTEKEEAINYFISQGKSGLSEMEELLYDSNPQVRILAIRALPLFDDFKEEVKSMLQDASDDEDSEVVEEIEKALKLL